MGGKLSTRSILSAVLGAFVASSLAAQQPRDCSSDCLQLLSAAAEWAVEDAIENVKANPQRLYVDLDGERSGDRERPSPAMLRAVSSRIGRPSVRRSQDQLWQTCVVQRSRDTCRREKGTAYIILRGPRRVAEDQALVHVRVRSLGDRSGGGALYSSSSSQLLMQKSADGVWSVAEVRLRVVS
jgi:hypothetical protein